ncbi:MAG: BolA family protein [Hydrogenophaga sp.]|jgi:BolA protein|uniref:BolA family protein n=1 Tax=Hydrogenophaga sp. TaxID=1904254 RepID=UPI001D5BD75E|nr:BolA family protein [Hydrogenophaga sp.]MBW0169569.1 BolA family transcriptional regulator [Hydrogenophaga sp.]MBW0182899.1 BolA family transcriptional regulator [Hydrogenophaga sp.]
MSSSPVVPTASAIEACLRDALAPSSLEVIDESSAHAGHSGANGLGYGTHFRVRIGGPAFAGRTRVAQHRLVYDALRNFTEAGMHALAIEIKA